MGVDAGVDTGVIGMDGGEGADVEGAGAGAEGPLHEKTEGPNEDLLVEREVGFADWDVPGIVYDDSFW